MTVVLYVILGVCLYWLVAGYMMRTQARLLDERERREECARLFRNQDEA